MGSKSARNARSFFFSSQSTSSLSGLFKSVYKSFQRWSFFCYWFYTGSTEDLIGKSGAAGLKTALTSLKIERAEDTYREVIKWYT
ncbi:hypothetical protein F9C07_2287831 [Aspergillus flavus]|uniref:Uncharacterized protein n=1 Tax=Aspergillus flavus (strain ATCC 200026 / FGSC A1120 / IAM 13836 / NRRL 3357 / JCM 12722 / SRRC 167) TaxID=332952 RepID=A0A7U2N0V5_ASPFN|nr:hypothetical protein F9C07_2287831 [Aspergillus flavus]